jgi:hypothetical protein
MKRLASVFAVVSLAVTGCGGSLCDDLADSDKSFYDKTKACSSVNDGTPYKEPTEADFDQCESSIKSCTDADKDNIGKFNDCVNGLPTCTASTEESFTNAFAGCALTHLSSITDACLKAAGQESIRTAQRLSSSR